MAKTSIFHDPRYLDFVERFHADPLRFCRQCVRHVDVILIRNICFTDYATHAKGFSGMRNVERQNRCIRSYRTLAPALPSGSRYEARSR